MRPRLTGALLGILTAFIGFATIPLDAGYPVVAGHFRRPLVTGSHARHLRPWILPIAPQIFLPLVGAGGGGAPGCTPVISLVQQNDALSGSCTSCVGTVASAPANGNMVELVTTGSKVSVTVAVSSVTSTNTTWTKDSSILVINGTTRSDTEVWHGLVSGGSGGTSVTVVWSSALGVSSFTYSLSEWSGTVTSSPADGAAVTNTSLSNSPVTGSYSTGAACELVIAVLADTANNGVNVFPVAPYTNLAQPGGASDASYNVASPLGSQTAATWTLSGSRNWGTIIQGYKHP